MNAKGSRSVFSRRTSEAEESLQRLLTDFDKLILDLGGDPKGEKAVSFKSTLRNQSEGLLEDLKIVSTTFNISSFFSSRLSLNEVLSLIAKRVKQRLNFSRVIIFLLNEDRTLLECKIMSGMSMEKRLRAMSRPFVMGKHDCVEIKTATSGQSYFIQDKDDPRLTDTDRKIITRMGRGCTIYTPITTKRGIIGVFGVDKLSSLPPLTPTDVSRIQLLANYVGILIENAKLYESILEHKNRFENIVKQSPNGVIISDVAGEIRLINLAAERLLGINKKEFLNRPIKGLLGKELIKRVTDLLSEQEQAEFYDLSFERPDGRRLHLNLNALNISIKSESVSELVILIQDITEKRMIDKHLQRLDKLASIGTMAAGIAHEIRSPLTSIVMDLDSLYEFASDKKKVQDTIVCVLSEIERIDTTISDLLQFSRPSSKEGTRFEISNIIDDSILLAKKKVGNKAIRFETYFSLNSLELRGNPDRLKQMLVNLLMNSIEAIDSEGVIRTETELLYKGNEYMNKALKDSLFNVYKSILRISIRDSGTGILAEFKDKVFDPYFTTKSYGTGLGLAIVSKIVEEHQGYVSVQSEPGCSTVFEIFIPADT